ncbi:MAG: hypothetical protein RSB51_06350 [Clostridia bacterium]
MSRFMYTIVVMSVTAALMTGGFIYGFVTTSTNKFNVEVEEIRKAKEAKNIEKENSNVIASNSKEIKKEEKVEEKTDKSKCIEVIYKDEYQKCGHKVESKINIFGMTMEELKADLREEIDRKGYKLKSEEENRLIYIKSFDQYCGDHYFVTIEADKVVIYNYASEGVKIKYQELVTPITKIREELKTKLAKGISIDSRNELYNLIEDIET